MTPVNDAAFHFETVVDGVTRIELPPLSGVRISPSAAANVYLIEDPYPALINAGHPAHADLLVDALRSRGITPADVERIIATSWRIDIVGGATQFPRADLFVLSPDMKAPRDYELHVEARRQRLTSLATSMAGEVDEFRRQPVDEAIDYFYPRMTRNLRFSPVRNGHFVHAGPLRLEVLATAGPAPGHMALYEADEQLLFCGDFAMSGLPDRIDNTRGYLVSLERLAELPSEQVCPNRGRTFQQGRWTVSRAANFLNNFLSNAPAAFVRAPTVLEFIARDRGTAFDDPVELVLTYELFETLFEELVRTRTVAAEGEGLQRRYGVDVDDPREQLRRH